MTDGPSVVVIGAGQSGLATGYDLQQLGVEFTILADDQRVGDTWRDRWDSLELSTPAFYDGLSDLEDGRPVTAADEAFDADNVVCAAGFHPHYPWIDLDVFDESDEPRHASGVVEEAPGLAFVGLHWQVRPDSSLIGGVGPDAKHVGEHIRATAG